MQTNPQAAQRAMADARVAAQIEKLMVAGKNPALSQLRALIAGCPLIYLPQAY
jgi:hypothetical protein